MVAFGILTLFKYKHKHHNMRSKTWCRKGEHDQLSLAKEELFWSKNYLDFKAITYTAPFTITKPFYLSFMIIPFIPVTYMEKIYYTDQGHLHLNTQA